MNLQELQENKKTKLVKRALREHYEISMDFDGLSLEKTQRLLGKTRDLLKQSRTGSAQHESHNNSAYLKLVMVEQALSDRLSDLRNPARIVVENEEVQKSQVILAAQDMIDSLQKMLEEISKMNVEELNAVVVGMKNEFGTEVGDQFSQAASQALMALQEATTTAKGSLTSALGQVTGETTGMPDAGGELGAPAPDIGGELGGDLGAEPAPELPEPEPAEEPEPEDLGGAGRGRR